MGLHLDPKDLIGLNEDEVCRNLRRLGVQVVVNDKLVSRGTRRTIQVRCINGKVVGAS